MSGAAQHKSEGSEPLVLIVQDKPQEAESGGILRAAGFFVAIAYDGLKAFEQIGEKRPDLILIDYASAAEGIEVWRRLKENMTAREIPMILAASPGECARVAEVFCEAAAPDSLIRPFQAEELLARVRVNLELSKARQELRRHDNRVRELKAEKNEFLSIVAHDLRSPLSNIVTSAEIVAADSEMPREQVNEFLEIICSAGKHMIHLVENLMDLNAIEQGRIKMDITPLELGELVRGVAANYDSKAKAKQQELAFHEEPGPLIAMADQHSAIQIFDNLVSNAIKYSPAGKRIDICLRRNNEMIRCEVRDQGPGLTKDDLQKMFGKFAKLSAQPTGGEPSTGLGLSIVKKFVEAAGGNVWCETEPGKGSTFVVELRSAVQAPVAQPA
jgi:two-component system sensor histidine kinase/response regulator